MRVIARFRLTGLLVTQFFTERGPVLAKSYFLVVKSWYISALLAEGLSGLTG